MTRDTERLQAIGSQEIQRHTEQAERLKVLAETLLDQAEYHINQADRWTNYLGSLAIGPVEVPSPRPVLTLIEGEKV